MLRDGVDGLAAGRGGNALSALAIVVSPELRGSRLAERLLLNMKACAIENGLAALVAPVRPTRKASYPLATFEDYVGWTTADGAPFDPWVRKHAARRPHRQGRAALDDGFGDAVAVDGMDGPALSGVGYYHVEGGLAPMIADCETGMGIYREPGLWLRHPL